MPEQSQSDQTTSNQPTSDRPIAQKAGGAAGASDAQRSPANRLGLDYREPPSRKISTRLIDAHAHVRQVEDAPRFFEVADRYNVDQVFTMTQLELAQKLHDAYPDRLRFIAFPNFKQFDLTEAFQQLWLTELAGFRSIGAKLCKFWMAPRMRERHGLTLAHDFVQRVIDRALELDYEFMVHISDPAIWFAPGQRYADADTFGTHAQQYEQLEYFLERVAPRRVIGAHLGGSIEDPDFLSRLLERYPNYYIDSSATKWVVREVSRQPDLCRAFFLRWQDRILFGSDIVTKPEYDFDHYASRYWAHQMLWESDYRGESNIEDPDSDPPQLNGLDLPAEVLEKLYRGNVLGLGFV